GPEAGGGPDRGRSAGAQAEAGAFRGQAQAPVPPPRHAGGAFVRHAGGDFRQRFGRRMSRFLSLLLHPLTVVVVLAVAGAGVMVAGVCLVAGAGWGMVLAGGFLLAAASFLTRGMKANG